MTAALPAPPVLMGPFSSKASPAEINDALVHMFLRELSTEPHTNLPTCKVCGYTYTISNMEGRTCTRPGRLNLPCGGQVERPWNKTTVGAEIARLEAGGWLYIASVRDTKELFGFVVCETIRQENLESTINMGRGVLSRVFGKVGRHVAYPLVTHFWVDEDKLDHRTRTVATELLSSTIETQVLDLCGRDVAPVLVLANQRNDVRTSVIEQIGFPLITRDGSHGRHRALYGHKIRIT